MLNLTNQGQTLIAKLASRYGVSQDAVAIVMQALVRGSGRAAQFSHPDFGGHCQWMSGGMTMTPDLFNHTLNAKVDGLCTDLAAALDTEASALYIPDTTRTGSPWWPFALGSPAAAGSQNHVSYAFFPEARRLAVEIKGHVTTYDLGEHQISGLAQQEGDDGNLAFISQNGMLSLADLVLVGSDVPPVEALLVSNIASPEASQEDIITTIERLSVLKDKGVLTPDEFAAKKAELLARL